MAEILVETLSSSSGGAIFQVTVRDGGSQTKHRVRMSHDFHQKLANGKSPEEFIKTSFEFLLARESKESTMSISEDALTLYPDHPLYNKI